MIDFQKLFPKKWKSLKSKMLKRDGRRCQFIMKNGKRCTHKRMLQMHHIFPKSEYPSMVWDLNNVITLCVKHHKEISKRENDYVHIFKKIIAKLEAMNDKKV